MLGLRITPDVYIVQGQNYEGSWRKWSKAEGNHITEYKFMHSMLDLHRSRQAKDIW